MLPLPRSAQLALFLGLLLPAAFAETAFWVMPEGNDSADGTAAAPVATLPRAAALVRAARAAQPAEPITVWIAPGTYPVLETFTLGPADSGTAQAPVTWRGMERARVRLTGARAVAPASLQTVTAPALLERMDPAARGQIVELDLDALGVLNARPFPDYLRDIVDFCAVFSDGRRLPLSRWPNGEYGYSTMKRVLSSGSFRANQPEGGVFEYNEDRPARWQTALTEGGVWLRGFWRVPWVAETLRVKAIDPAARTLGFAISTSQGIGSKYSPLVDGTRIGDGKENWFALNLLEEIDQPGEWSVDFKRRKLYLWPASPGASIAIADNGKPLLAFENASYITVRDLTLGQQMGDAVTITDGASIRIAGCEINGVVRRAVFIRGGRDHVIQSSDLTEIGLAAIDLLGGDRATLTPSGHQILNNHIYRAALNAPTPTIIAGLDAPTQQLVGARFAYNRIHDVSYSGVHFGGNDNIFEFNELYRLGLDGGDLGGFYTTGGWTSRGNVVRSNFIHHSENANAIYMDDGNSGLLAEDNLIYRTESGIFIGGGHDHIARRNLIVQAHNAIHVDDRGIARLYIATDPRLRKDLDSVPYKSSPWREKYPALLGILDTDPSIPHGSLLTGNIVVGCGAFARRSGDAAVLAAGFRFEANTEVADLSALVDPAGLNFTPRDLAANPELKPFAALDLARYGIQPDEFRTTIPARDIELLRSGNTKRKAFDSQQDVNAYARPATP